MARQSVAAIILFAGSSWLAVDAWGPDGHTIVAHIANNLVSDDVRQVLSMDLNTTGLTNASRFPDGYDHTRAGRWSAPLHFINYPGQACNFIWERDCKDDMCNPGALINYSRQIFSRRLPAEQRTFALEMVIHMMGDLHQPLHVGSTDDEGGNFVHGHFFNVDYNFNGTSSSRILHALWDEDIVIQDIADEPKLLGATEEDEDKYVPVYHNWPEITQVLTQRIESTWHDQVPAWSSDISAPTDANSIHSLRDGLSLVGNETAALGCEYAYINMDGSRIQPGDFLGREYYMRAKPIIEKQLAKAGVRLAVLLSDALSAITAEEAAAHTVVMV